ncbi:MAG TPA: O-antigen ligase family protein [Xanthobacteraceae bacterium]
MTDSTWGARASNVVNRLGFARAADAYAALVAASLPWSTTATTILIVAWLVILLPTLDVATMRREIMTAAGGAPLILLALAALGTLWADVSVTDRLGGLEGYLKLLFIPFLFAQFRRSPNGGWVIIGFFGSGLALLVLSWAMVLIPDWPWHGKFAGIPVKDYITQSGVFALCAFAALRYATDVWRNGQRRRALMLICAAAAFIANIAYVETGRTTLVAIAVLAPLFGFRRFGWKGMAAAVVVASVLAGIAWVSSPYLRFRVTFVAEEVQRYQASHEPTSTGARLDFWRNSLESIAKAPIAGHGTGSIPEQLASTVSPDTGMASIATVNPHNEIFVAAVQLGLIGAAALFSMWISHLLLFRGNDAISWMGMVAVVQNVVGSLANSHLSDFTQGWIYVFAIGALGGMVLRQGGPPPAGSLSVPAR